MLVAKELNKTEDQVYDMILDEYYLTLSAIKVIHPVEEKKSVLE